MAMAVDSRQQLLGGMHYDNHLRYNAPHFTNPWASSSNPYASQPHQSQQTTQAPPQMQLPPVTTAGLDPKVSRAQLSTTTFPQLTPTTTAHAASYGVSAYDHVNSLDNSSHLLARSYGADYSSPTTTQASAFAPTSAPHYPAAYQQGTFNAYTPDPPRPAYTHRAPQLGREDFHEALDASRSMVGINNDLTPRPIYANDNARQDSQDAYGFPAPHSAHSSISSASTYPSYYNGSINSSTSGSIAGSVDGSITDYSSAGEEIIPGRQLPRPILNGTIPPAASSMMSQFNSKVSPSTQKKHKCKICDKRFTRPSSLQTHMYSHTGEKPFACDAEGCGRHFSVVSNLRRHKKVHRGENDHNSPDDE